MHESGSFRLPRSASAANNSVVMPLTWYGRVMTSEREGGTAEAIETPRSPRPEKPSDEKPSRLDQGISLGNLVIGLVVCVVTILGTVFAMVNSVSSKVDDLRKETNSEFTSVRMEVFQARSDLARISGALEQVDRRVTVIEERVNAKFGTEVDAGPNDVDAGSTRTWSTDHVVRRERFCAKTCVRGHSDAECFEACASAYNLCGIRCQSNPTSPCFASCTNGIVSPQAP